MKPFLYIILGFILISCGAVTTTYQDNPHTKTRYYNKDGRYTGYSIQSEYGKTRYYDEKGRYKGYSK